MLKKLLQARRRDSFVDIDVVDNFYQTSSFIPMSFALVTTVHVNGETGIGPHALVFPFSVTKPYSMLLISRNNSGTAVNVRRHGKCSLNYVPYDRRRLQGIANLGYPGMPLADKHKANPYTLIKSPSPEKAGDRDAPQIIDEAYQVFECTWDDRFGFHERSDDMGEPYDGHFHLLIDHILMKERLVPGIEQGQVFPNTPIFYGFRANRGFWFAKHARPFNVAAPTVKGLEYQMVYYLANRIDSRVRFSEQACRKLTGIPRPFLRRALKQIVATAIEDGVHQIDEAYLDKINAQR